MARQTGYTSNVFYHFVGRHDPPNHDVNYNILLRVLDSGQISYPPHIRTRENQTGYRFNWDKNLLSQELIVPTVTCYCDIPIDHLGIHTTKYGRFGIGFDKSLLVKYGARPVIYLPYQPSDWTSPSPYGMDLIRDIEQRYRSFWELVVSKTEEEEAPSRELGKQSKSQNAAIHEMSDIFVKDFLAFAKPFNVSLADDHPANYYMEREWRKFGFFYFQPDEIESIFLATSYAERLREDRPQYSGTKLIECA
jgi:Putative abortive phage resistance protein AbiGi, antitoxin